MVIRVLIPRDIEPKYFKCILYYIFVYVGRIRKKIIYFSISSLRIEIVQLWELIVE